MRDRHREGVDTAIRRGGSWPPSMWKLTEEIETPPQAVFDVITDLETEALKQRAEAV